MIPDDDDQLSVGARKPVKCATADCKRRVSWHVAHKFPVCHWCLESAARKKAENFLRDVTGEVNFSQKSPVRCSISPKRFIEELIDLLLSSGAS